LNRSLALALFLLSACLGSAQDTTSAARLSSIAGAVVQEPGSQPLKKVLVQIVAEDQKQGGNYTVLTDADGRFSVENVAPGRYRFFVERTGFTGVNQRGLQSDTNIFTVPAGQSVTNLLFRMSPTAVITGRIIDEDGDPMSGVNVIAQKKKAGKATRESVATGTTNDLGEFRLAGLFSGQYWILAVPPPDPRDYEHREKSPPAGSKGATENENDTRYLTTYYPGTTDSMQAAPVALKAGDEMPVNLMLTPVRTYCVRGVVSGADPQNSTVMLFSKGGYSYRASASEIGPDGQFEVRGVAPGSYVAVASSGTEGRLLTARQDVTVVAADVEGVKLIPEPSFTISGHLRVDAEGGVPANLAQYAVNLRGAEVPDDPGFFMAQDFFGANASVDRLGNFNWKDVNPGNYIVQLLGRDAQSGFYLRSVTLAGKDVTTGFTASGPATLEVVVGTKAGTIEGTVAEREASSDSTSIDSVSTDSASNAPTNNGSADNTSPSPASSNTALSNAASSSNDHPAANAIVVAVPEEKYRKLPYHFVSGSTDQFGHFLLRGLAPGSYTLYAWRDVEDDVWRDPDFLKSQEANGTSVKVEEGSNQRIDLKLSPAGDEWR
jgi:hypothetical protein